MFLYWSSFFVKLKVDRLIKYFKLLINDCVVYIIVILQPVTKGHWPKKILEGHRFNFRYILNYPFLLFTDTINQKVTEILIAFYALQIN